MAYERRLFENMSDEEFDRLTQYKDLGGNVVPPPRSARGSQRTGARGSYGSLNRGILSGARGSFGSVSHGEMTGTCGNYGSLNRGNLTGARGSFGSLNRGNLTGARGSFGSLNRVNLTGARGSFGNLSRGELTGARNVARNELAGARASFTRGEVEGEGASFDREEMAGPPGSYGSWRRGQMTGTRGFFGRENQGNGTGHYGGNTFRNRNEELSAQSYVSFQPNYEDDGRFNFENGPRDSYREHQDGYQEHQDGYQEHQDGWPGRRELEVGAVPGSWSNQRRVNAQSFPVNQPDPRHQNFYHGQESMTGYREERFKFSRGGWSGQRDDAFLYNDENLSRENPFQRNFRHSHGVLADTSYEVNRQSGSAVRESINIVKSSETFGEHYHMGGSSPNSISVRDEKGPSYRFNKNRSLISSNDENEAMFDILWDNDVPVYNQDTVEVESDQELEKDDIIESYMTNYSTQRARGDKINNTDNLIISSDEDMNDTSHEESINIENESEDAIINYMENYSTQRVSNEKGQVEVEKIDGDIEDIDDEEDLAIEEYMAAYSSQKVTTEMNNDELSDDSFSEYMTKYSTQNLSNSTENICYKDDDKSGEGGDITSNLSNTVRKTVTMFKEKKSIEEIAHIRKLKTSTLMFHLATAVEHGTKVDIAELNITESIMRKVAEVICKPPISSNISRLAPIKNQLDLINCDLTLDQIALIVSSFKRDYGVNEEGRLEWKSHHFNQSLSAKESANYIVDVILTDTIKTVNIPRCIRLREERIKERQQLFEKLNIKEAKEALYENHSKPKRQKRKLTTQLVPKRHSARIKIEVEDDKKINNNLFEKVLQPKKLKSKTDENKFGRYEKKSVNSGLEGEIEDEYELKGDIEIKNEIGFNEDGKVETVGKPIIQTKLKQSNVKIFSRQKDRCPVIHNKPFIKEILCGNSASECIRLWKLSKVQVQEILQNEAADVALNSSKNSRAPDTINDIVQSSYSESFWNSLSWAMNKLVLFVEDNKKFEYFDWFTADVTQVDEVVSHLICWLQPLERSCALGDRFVPTAQKNLMSGLNNMLTHVLKRPECRIKQGGLMPRSMAANRSKKFMYSISNQAQPQGTRKRQHMASGDQEKRDQWMLRDPKMYNQPEEILLVAGSILLELMALRGTSVIEQIRRRGFRFNQVDDQGREYIHIFQGASRKPQGPSSSNEWKPLDAKIYGQHEQEIFKLLLQKLPTPGCNFCLFAANPTRPGENKECACENIFLRGKKNWTFNNVCWFERIKWSKEKTDGICAAISSAASLSKRYTNGCMRPTVVTNLADCDYQSNEIAVYSDHIDFGTLERYKRQAVEANSRDKVVANSIMLPSGRDALRGKENCFGEIVPIEKKTLFENHQQIRKGQGFKKTVRFEDRTLQQQDEEVSFKPKANLRGSIEKTDVNRSMKIKSAISATKKPAISATKKPAISATKKPAISATKKPAISVTKKPAISATMKPVISATKKTIVSASKKVISATKTPIFSPTKKPSHLVSTTATRPNLSKKASSASSPTASDMDSSSGLASVSEPKLYIQDEVETQIKGTETFDVGSPIFAKLGKDPAWPAIIEYVFATTRQFHVRFLGTGQSGTTGKVYPYEIWRQKYSIPDKKLKGLKRIQFLDGIAEIERIYESQS